MSINFRFSKALCVDYNSLVKYCLYDIKHRLVSPGAAFGQPISYYPVKDKYLENTYHNNDKIIFETANKQFISGEINYLDWVMLTNQAISIQSNYLDAIKNLNETIIQINYLITKYIKYEKHILHSVFCVYN